MNKMKHQFLYKVHNAVVDTWEGVHLATGALPGNSMSTWVSARIKIFMIDKNIGTRWKLIEEEI